MLTMRQKVVWFALSTRVAVIVIQFLSNVIIPDHNATDVFIRPTSPAESTGFLDKIISVLLGGFERWDAQYFLHIAEHGYVYENSFAFFPLFPMAVRVVARLLSVVFYGSMKTSTLVLLSSTILNTFCFTKAADLLYLLSLDVLGNSGLAYQAALFFCINPASIFFSAPYSEASFAMLSFYGMTKGVLELSAMCGIPFGLAAATRSNGILNIGFILYSNFKRLFVQKLPNLLNMHHGLHKIFIPYHILVLLFPLVNAVTLTLVPFLAFQMYCYNLFCVMQEQDIPVFLQEHALKMGYVTTNYSPTVSNQKEHWCQSSIPLAYSYVQNHYWGVGFFRYYHWKQIPNFLLAVPILVLVFTQAAEFYRQHSGYCLKLGFVSKYINDKELREGSIMSHRMFVFIAHAVFLAIFCLIFVHIQVTTRMICSASPVPYWFAAYLWSQKPSQREKQEDTSYNEAVLKITKQILKAQNQSEDVPHEVKKSVEKTENRRSIWKVIILTELPQTLNGKLVRFYFLSYFVVGILLFSNFLPWT